MSSRSRVSSVGAIEEALKDHPALAQLGSKVEEPEERDDSQFSSRWAFWISAIGCSVGFGNLWRFPYLVWTYGGGAFFIPYILSLFVLVLPLTFLEFGVGQLSQGGQVKAFRSIHGRVACVGWCFWMCLNILQFYPLLLSWSLMYFGNSFKTDLPWLVSDAEDAACKAATDAQTCLAQVACSWDGGSSTCNAFVLNKAVNFFEVDLSAKREYWEGIQEFNGFIFMCETASWVLVCLATLGGAKILGYINYFITVAPAFFLLILVGVGASLDGSGDGVKEYIGKFNVDTLKGGAVWTAAATQALFSMGATQTSMAGYAAHNKREQNFVQDSFVVAAGDTMFAVIAGFAVFSVIGYMSWSTGIPLLELPLSGTGLAFQTYPVGIGEAVPYPGAQIFSVMFFMTLWLLGMSTCVGLIEGVVLIIVDSRFWANSKTLKKWHAYVGVCMFLYLFAFLYSTDMGIHFLDCLDGSLGTFGYIFVAGCEAISAGWFSAFDLWKERVGPMAIYVHMTTYILGCFLAAVIGFSCSPDVGKIVGPVLGVVFMGGGFIWALIITRKSNPRTGQTFSFGDRFCNLTFYNINQLRDYMNSVACRGSCWHVPRLWSLCIKYFIPTLTTLMFSQAVTDKYAMYARPQSAGSSNGAYPWYVFVVSNFGPYVGFFGILIFFFMPRWMGWLAPVDDFKFEYPDEETRLDQIISKVDSLRSRSHILAKSEQSRLKDSSKSSSSSSSSSNSSSHR